MPKKNIFIRSKLRKAEQFLEENKPQEAITVYDDICKRDGSNAEIWMRLSTLHRQAGNNLQAERCAKKAVKLSPDSPVCSHLLGAALHAQGRTDEAIKHYETAIQRQPDLIDSHYYLANALRESGNIDDAVTAYKRLLQVNPDHFSGLNNYGALLTNIGGAEDAIKTLTHALDINGNSVETLTNLARAQILIGAHEIAIKFLRKAILLRPGFLDAHIELAWALRLDGKYDDALQSFAKALELSPGNSRVLTGKAKILEILGRTQEAYEILQPFINDKASEALPVYFDLSHHFGEREQAAAMIQELLDRDGLNVKGSAPLHFRLGRYHDKKGQYRAAFKHFREANAVANKSFSIEEASQLFQAIKAVYSHNFVSGMECSNNTSNLPVFIVGMPRSGTSLVEQIIASHPDIYGAGETINIDNISKYLSNLASHGQYPEYARTISSAALDKASSDYIASLSAISPGSRRVTDKMPHNFVFIGLIFQLFPYSNIIHCKRNPLDTCLSCYFSEFASNFHNYTYDFETLVSYYRLYQDLMHHWISVFPDRIHEVSYEALVSNQETESRKLLEYCDMEWDEQCLEFHKSGRIVNTISYNQVRQPLYNKSVNRWLNYEPYLSQYIEMLNNSETET